MSRTWISCDSIPSRGWSASGSCSCTPNFRCKGPPPTRPEFPVPIFAGYADGSAARAEGACHEAPRRPRHRRLLRHPRSPAQPANDRSLSSPAFLGRPAGEGVVFGRAITLLHRISGGLRGKRRRADGNRMLRSIADDGALRCCGVRANGRRVLRPIAHVSYRRPRDRSAGRIGAMMRGHRGPGRCYENQGDREG